MLRSWHKWKLENSAACQRWLLQPPVAAHEDRAGRHFSHGLPHPPRCGALHQNGSAPRSGGLSQRWEVLGSLSGVLGGASYTPEASLSFFNLFSKHICPMCLLHPKG